MFSLQENRKRRRRNRFCLEADVGGLGGEEEVAQAMYTHISKFKNDKIKGEKKSKLSVMAIAWDHRYVGS
jgi:hypothetical protein